MNVNIKRTWEADSLGIAKLTDVDRAVVMKKAVWEMREVLMVITGTTHVLTRSARDETAGEFLHMITDGAEQLTCAVQTIALLVGKRTDGEWGHPLTDGA